MAQGLKRNQEQDVDWKPSSKMLALWYHFPTSNNVDVMALALSSMLSPGRNSQGWHTQIKTYYKYTVLNKSNQNDNSKHN